LKLCSCRIIAETILGVSLCCVSIACEHSLYKLIELL